MNARRGYSLIEMLIVLTCLAVVLGLCVGSLHGLIRLDRSARSRLSEEAALDRLGRQFRHDVRAARTGRALADDRAHPQLALALPDGAAVEYRWEGNRLLRVEQRTGAADRFETYRLPRRSPPRFEVREAKPWPWVTLSFEADEPAPAAHPAFRAEAWLGKDRRWSKSEDRKP